MTFDSADGPVDDQTAPAGDELLSQLRVIEDQPLEDRAAAYAHLFDQLRSTLEAGDPDRRHG